MEELLEAVKNKQTKQKDFLRPSDGIIIQLLDRKVSSHNTGWLFRPHENHTGFYVGLLFTHYRWFRRDFCDGAKLLRADLENEASQIG